jgi:hypothetical protein
VTVGRNFREEDAPFFCGREAATSGLVEAVERDPLVAVMGAVPSRGHAGRADTVPRAPRRVREILQSLSCELGIKGRDDTPREVVSRYGPGQSRSPNQYRRSPKREEGTALRSDRRSPRITLRHRLCADRCLCSWRPVDRGATPRIAAHSPPSGAGKSEKLRDFGCFTGMRRCARRRASVPSEHNHGGPEYRWRTANTDMQGLFAKGLIESEKR